MGTSEEGVKRCACGKPADVEARMTISALTEAGKRLVNAVEPSFLTLCFWCAMRAALGVLEAPETDAGRVPTPEEGEAP